MADAYSGVGWSLKRVVKQTGGEVMLPSRESNLAAMDRLNGIEMTTTGRHDQYVQYNHEMSDDTAEASARILIRTVPLIYGGLVGGVLGDLPLGLVVGLATTIALDLKMNDHSITLRLIRPLLRAFRVLR